MSNLLQKAYFSNNIDKKKPHYHDCHQIILFTKGTVEIKVKNQNLQVTDGNLLIFSRFENHSTNILSKEYERYVLHINANAKYFENHIFSLLFNRPEGFCNAFDVSANLKYFKDLFDRLIDEHNRNERLTEDMQKLLLQEILIMLYRQLPDSFCFDPTVFSIQQKFESDCSKPYTLKELADEYSMSVSSLSHRFKSITGSSIMSYLLSCRVAYAQTLLVATNLDVGQIVEKCGFSDNSNFSRTFKQMNGIPPTAFRKKYKD